MSSAPPQPGTFVTVEEDVTDPTYYRDHDPYPLFDRLRHAAAVVRSEHGRVPHWMLLRHEDVSNAFLRTDIFSTEWGVTLDTIRLDDRKDPATDRMLEFSNPAHHRALRNEFSRYYNREPIAALEPVVRDYAAQRVEAAAARGSFDFAAEVADPVTSAVVFGLLGFPRADWEELFDLSRRSQEETHPSVTGRPPFATSANQANFELMKYLKRLVRGSHGPAQGHLAALATVELDGRRLTEEEVLLNILNIMQGGNSTTRHAASSGVLTMTQFPQQWQRLRPGGRVAVEDIPLLVEEVVRWTSPAMHLARRVTQDVEVGGRLIRAGEVVSLWVLSANRDEAVFDQPYRFDALRRPNRHLGFLSGPHLCMGIHVARIELLILFEEVLRRLPALELTGPVRKVPSNFVTGLESVPVRLVG